MELTTLNPWFLWILEMGFLCDFAGIAFHSVLNEECHAHLRMERASQANKETLAHLGKTHTPQDPFLHL